MGLLDKTLSKLFGSKSDRDLKELSPYLGDIKEESDRIQTLSHDELRAESQILKAKIQEYIKDENDQINGLKDKIETGGLSETRKIILVR